MIIDLKDHWTSPGDPAAQNEDGWGMVTSKDTDALWLIDGCTDLDRDRSAATYPDGSSSAFWYKETLSRHLKERLSGNAFTSPQTFIKSVVEDVRRDYVELGLDYAKPFWAMPSSTLTMAMLSKTENKLRLIWSGDSYGLIKKQDGQVVIFPATKKTVPPGNSELTTLVKDRIDDYRRERSEHIEKGDLSLSIFPDRLKGLHFVDLDASKCRAIILASDGFLRLVTDFDISPEILFKRAAQEGLASCGSHLRLIERNNTEKLKFYQSKIHDDATAVFAHLAPG